MQIVREKVYRDIMTASNYLSEDERIKYLYLIPTEGLDEIVTRNIIGIKHILFLSLHAYLT